MATERDPIDGLLRKAFAGEPVPALPRDFDARLARRLAAEEVPPPGHRRPLPARDRWLLRGYWTLAALLSVAVLTRVDLGPLPWPIPWPALLALAVTAAGLAVPILALRRATAL